MGRITYNDKQQLAQVSNQQRYQILCKHLKEGKNQQDIARDVFHDYGDWASMRVSVVTRGFGFHEGRGKKRYSSIPDDIIWKFVCDYNPEDYDGGLDDDTFDDYIYDYRQQLAAQRQWEEQQRRWQEEEDERRRQQQLEYARQYEELQRQQEAERRQREEQERQERLRREQEAREKEALRQAAIARGDHTRLMNEGFAALEEENYALARSKAEQAWALNPMIGLQYIFAFCAAAQGDRSGALKWAGDALEGYEEGCRQYLDLCVLYLNNGGNNRAVEYGRKLYDKGILSRLNDKGLSYLGTRVYKSLFHMEGGLRLAYKNRTKDTAYMQFAEDLSLLIADRIPTDNENRTLLLNCAFILTRRKHYRTALDIYYQYENGDCCSLDSPAFDLRAHMGFCYYGMGDQSSALHIWYPDLLYHPHFNTFPMDVLWAYNYDDILLEITNHHPEVQEHIDFTREYVDGNIPGSVYYSRYYSNWRSHLGLEPDEDTRWYCDEDDIWHVDIFTQRPTESLKEQAKSFFGRLFGKY